MIDILFCRCPLNVCMVLVFLESTLIVLVIVVKLKLSVEKLFCLLTRISCFASLSGSWQLTVFRVVSQISTSPCTIKPLNLIYYVKGDFPPRYF